MKKKLTTLFLTLVVFSSPLWAAPDTTRSFPVYFNFGLNNKLLPATTTSISGVQLRVEGNMTHSIGMHLGFEMGLNDLVSNDIHWSLQSRLALFTVPVKFTGRLPKEFHGFDRDVTWAHSRYAAGVEGFIGVLRTSPLSKTWDIRLGAGVNITDYYLRPNHFDVRQIAVVDGIATQVTVLSPFTNTGPFGRGFSVISRDEQDLAFNPVFTVGFQKNNADFKGMQFDLRFCTTNNKITQNMFFQLGDTGNLEYRQSFVELNISYSILTNRKTSTFVN